MMCRKLNSFPSSVSCGATSPEAAGPATRRTAPYAASSCQEGLKESDKLPEPIYTPSTKAEIGDHDENISYEQSIAHLEKYFPGKGEEYAAKLRDYTLALYKKCADYALSRGIHHRRHQVRVWPG